MPEISIASPVGALVVTERDGRIVRIGWTDDKPADESETPTPLLREAAAQLDAYFAGDLTAFDLPLAPDGSDFQKRVWKAMAGIPYGETRTYGEIAAQVDAPARAVGGACGANPIPIVLPCHRVVAANGAGGYSGYGGLRTKGALLDIETRKTRLL